MYGGGGDIKNGNPMQIKPLEFSSGFYHKDKSHLLNSFHKNKELPIILDKNVLAKGEFWLYGSSLFVDNPDDYDIMYYGETSEDEITKIVNNKKVSIIPIKKDNGGTDKFRNTHIFFAHDNGIPLSPCPKIQKMYEKIQNSPWSRKAMNGKMFLSYRYYKDGDFVREFKTMLIFAHYMAKEYKNREITEYLWNNLHLTYRALAFDKKAYDILAKHIARNFNRKIVLRFDSKRALAYKNWDSTEILNSFFPSIN